MSSPKSVQIGPHKYSIVYDEYRCEDSEELYGFVKPEKCEIVINPKNSLSWQKETLVHEILHALWQTAGFEKNESLKHNEESEEQIVNLLAPLLLDVIRRNKPLITFLENE